MHQREFWDGVAATKTFAHPFDRARFSALVDRSARILDYGCGYGRVCAQLFDEGYREVVGVDPSPRMIDRALAEHPAIAFDVVDDEALPFPDQSVGAVILFSVLTCIPNDAGQRAVVNEIARVLRPGGVIYVSDLLLQDDDRNRERYEAYDGRSRGVRLQPDQNVRLKADTTYGTFELEPGVVFRHLARPWIDELFAAFDRIELVDVPVVTMNGNPARGFQYFGRR